MCGCPILLIDDDDDDDDENLCPTKDGCRPISTRRTWDEIWESAVLACHGNDRHRNANMIKKTKSKDLLTVRKCRFVTSTHVVIKNNDKRKANRTRVGGVCRGLCGNFVAFDFRILGKVAVEIPNFWQSCIRINCLRGIIRINSEGRKQYFRSFGKVASESLVKVSSESSPRGRP